MDVWVAPGLELKRTKHQRGTCVGDVGDGDDEMRCASCLGSELI